MARKNKGAGYQGRLMKAVGSIAVPPGTVGHVTVIHGGDRCRLLKGAGPCSCTPEISIHLCDGEVAVVDPAGSVSRVKLA
jgi:hypothetical protein